MEADDAFVPTGIIPAFIVATVTAVFREIESFFGEDDCV